MKIKNSVLYTLSAILLFTYLLSFTKVFNSDKRKVQKTALLNPKYKEQITSIELSSENQQLILEKNNDFWIVQDGEAGFSAPASKNQVENFINTLTKIVNVYKISDQMSKNNDYSFDFSIKISYADTYSQLIFGKQDFSQTLRYFMTGRSAAVYQAGSDFESFLTISQRFWTEPELISKSITKNISYTDIQRITISDFQTTRILTPEDNTFKAYASDLLELRHGGIYQLQEPAEDSIAETINIPILRIKLELGNKDEIVVQAYQATEDNYRLSVHYPKIKYEANFKISPWTLSKLSQKELN